MRPSIAAIANNWTRGAAHRHTTAAFGALGLHPIARELLLISRPAQGRRLSWPAHRVGYQLAQGCLHHHHHHNLYYLYLKKLGDGLGEIRTHSVKVTSPIPPPLAPLHLQRHTDVNNLLRVATRQCDDRESN